MRASEDRVLPAPGGRRMGGEHRDRIDLRDYFARCEKSDGGCGGYHPGGAQVCWIRPGHDKSRIGEAAYRGYISDTPIQIPTTPMYGIQQINPTIHPGDELQYCILTQSAAELLRQNDENTSLTVKRFSNSRSRNLLIVEAPKRAPVDQSSTTSTANVPPNATHNVHQAPIPAANVSTHVPSMPTANGKANATPNSATNEPTNVQYTPNLVLQQHDHEGIDKDLLQEHQKVIQDTKRARFLLELQHNKEELMKLQAQLKPAHVENPTGQAPATSIASQSKLPKPTGSTSNEGAIGSTSTDGTIPTDGDKTNDEPPVDIPHIASTVGKWTMAPAKKGECKWTKALVEELIGPSTVARKGFWWVFTSHYHDSHITQELQQALEWNRSDAVSKALIELKVKVQDFKDLHNADINGLPAGTPPSGRGGGVK